MNQDRKKRVKSLIMGGNAPGEDRSNDVASEGNDGTAAPERPGGEGASEGTSRPNDTPASTSAEGTTKGVTDDPLKERILTAVKEPAPSVPEAAAPSGKKAPSWASRMTSGPVRGLQLSLQNTAEGAVIELDPALLEPSMVVDRVIDPSDHTFSLLVDSMRERGQQVPILVRPHPTDKGRYQIAYGHRRWRAASALGQPVRAVVRTLSNDELVVAQGKENLERRDLSYIERALFAWRMESQGFKRDTICAAMATVDSELSRYIAVAESVPETLIAAIGPAPKVGRPRWIAFADRLKKVGLPVAEAAVLEEGFAEKPTNDRFAAVQAALQSKAEPKPSRPKLWKDVAGRKLARFEETPDRFSLIIDRKIEPEFGRYLLDRLPEILAAFRGDEVSPSSQPKQKGDESPE